MGDLDEKELRRTFDLYDIEKKEKIRTSDLSNALQKLDKSEKDTAQADIRDVMDCFKDKEDISFEEFMEAAGRLELHQAFRQFDTKGKGWITKEMLFNILEPMLGSDMSKEEIDDTIESADQNGDGEIDIKEFVDLMMG